MQEFYNENYFKSLLVKYLNMFLNYEQVFKIN